MVMRNILKKDLYLIDNKLQAALSTSTGGVYSKGIYLIKTRKVK